MLRDPDWPDEVNRLAELTKIQKLRQKLTRATDLRIDAARGGCAALRRSVSRAGPVLSPRISPTHPQEWGRNRGDQPPAHSLRPGWQQPGFIYSAGPQTVAG